MDGTIQKSSRINKASDALAFLMLSMFLQYKAYGIKYVMTLIVDKHVHDSRSWNNVYSLNAWKLT